MFKRGVIWVAVSTKSQADDDKISLKLQEDLGRKWMADNGVSVVAVLTVPGHSRAESDVFDAFAEFEAKKMWAYHNLRSMWKSKSFDILWAFDHSRLGRSHTLHSFVVENVINSGAQIVLEQGGSITTSSASFQIATGGFMVTAHAENIKAKIAVAFPALANRGLPHGTPFWTHKVVRDERGRPQKLVLNDVRLPLFRAMIDLLLTGLAWRKMGLTLAEMGWTQDNGEPYPETSMRRTFYHPYFWGHTGHHFNNKDAPTKNNLGAWVFDESIPVPDGITLFRNRIPAVVPKHLEEQIKAELRRRNALVGRASAANARMFDNVILCSVCKRRMNHRRTERHLRYYCCHHYDFKWQRTCQNTRNMRVEYIQREVDRLLRLCLTDDIFEMEKEPDEVETRLKEIEQAIASKEASLRALIIKQSQNPLIADMYMETIEKLSQEREALKYQATAIIQKVKSARELSQRHTETLEELRTMDIDEFWKKPEPEINQFLLRLFDTHCLIGTPENTLFVAKRPSLA